jgi:hypothetical protein
LEADIPAYGADTLFSKPPQSGKAEEQPVVAIALTVSKVSKADGQILDISIPVLLTR